MRSVDTAAQADPPTHRLTWRGTRAALDALDLALTEVMDPPADAVSLVKDEEAEADGDSGWALHAYFAGGPDDASLSAAIAGLDADPGEAEREVLEQRDWVAHALEGLGIVQAGPFVVFGSHDAARTEGLPGHKLQIEANRAFGTGHHPTTEGCLCVLASIEDTLPERMLDLGTGSGLLAIAGRRLWPQVRIVATDIDAPSVRIAEENAEQNEAEGIVFRVADGVDDEVRAQGPYGCVTANILAEPLIALAPDVASVLAPGGRLVLAGLLARQEDAVREAYESVGLTLLRRHGQAWPVLLLGKNEKP